jgi:hypothetical protein
VSIIVSLPFVRSYLALPAFAQDGAVVRQQRFNQRDTDRERFPAIQGEYGGHPGNFRALDRDSDNRLSRDEFVRRGGDVVRELPDAFADLDLNGDSTLSRSEWYGRRPRSTGWTATTTGASASRSSATCPRPTTVRTSSTAGTPTATASSRAANGRTQGRGLPPRRRQRRRRGVPSRVPGRAAVGQRQPEARFDALDRTQTRC